MPAPDSTDRSARWIYWIGSVLFLCSGATGLAYEVIWFKRFSHVWGNSTLATAAVVASFLSGLGLGAAWLGRFADRVSSPLRWYGVFEIGIGVLALIVPLVAGVMITWAIPAVAPLHDVPLLHSLVRFILTFAVIGLPCMLMGGTLPLLVRQFGATAWLYAVNTLGAALGCYLTGFHLLPTFGLSRTNAGAAALNVAIGTVAIAVGRRAAPVDAPGRPVAGAADASVEGRGIYLVSALTGAAALILQLVWSRQLAVILGGSTYAFTAMLVVILVGIGIGSFVLHPWLQHERIPRASAAAVVVAVMVTAVIGQWGRDILIDLVGVASSLRAAQTVNAFVSVMTSCVLELLPALGMGVLFPMLVALAGRRGGKTGASVGSVYAWNTIGTIAGSVATPLLLLPAWGTARCITFALGLYGIALLLLALPGGRRGPWRILLPAVGVASLLLSAGQWNQDPRHAHLGSYLYGYYSEKERNEREVVFFAEGAAASVMVVRLPDGLVSLNVNGKADASSSRDDMRTQLAVAYLPRFLRPAARTALVIGLGSGTTAGASLLFPDTDVTAVEIEPAIAATTRHFAHVNHRPEESPRFRLVIDDGRGFLQGSTDAYDIVVSEPTNPWIAGVSNLFTREFYEVVRSRLRPGGLLAQWIQLYGLAPADYGLILRTVMSVFPHVGLLHLWTGDTVLVASQETLDGDAGTIRDAQALVDATPDVQADLRLHFGTTDVTSLLLTYFVLDEAGVGRAAAASGDEGINTDANLRLEFDAPRRMFAQQGGNDINRMIAHAADPGWFTGAFERWGGDAERAGVFHTLTVNFSNAGAGATAGALAAYGYRRNPQIPQLAGDIYAMSQDAGPEETARLVDALVTHSETRATQLGEKLLRVQRATQALPIFERLTVLHPQSALQRLNLARTYRALGRKTEGAREIAIAFDLDPFNPSVAEEYEQVQREGDVPLEPFGR